MSQETITLDQPKVHLVHMAVFTLIVAIIAAVLFPSIRLAFMANPGLNGLIIATLLLGLGYAFRMVWRLFPEVNWVNNFRLGEPSPQPQPALLGPMATLLGDAGGRTVLSPQTMRSMLDSLASRLDESRDLLRYLVGLLIFLGLLGTFWGLLETVSSVGAAIQNLDVTSAQSSSVFEELKTGLQKPLAGMGISFSSSLFGLASSLILGFMDLKASQAQNRFYHNLEDWLTAMTDVRAGDGGALGGIQSQADMRDLQRAIDRIGRFVEQGKGNAAATNSAESMEQLADAVANLVTQMREEQKMVRQWIQSQSVQQGEITRLLSRKPGAKE